MTSHQEVAWGDPRPSSFCMLGFGLLEMRPNKKLQSIKRDTRPVFNQEWRDGLAGDSCVDDRPLDSASSGTRVYACGPGMNRVWNHILVVVRAKDATCRRAAVLKCKKQGTGWSGT